MAVSIKMNILLFAPALLFAYIFTQGYFGTLKQLAICASFQLIVALPFLYENPINYINGSFDFGRVFMHKWTVNWRFVPECLFVHKGMYRFHEIFICNMIINNTNNNFPNILKSICLYSILISRNFCYISRISLFFTGFTYIISGIFNSTMGSVV